MPTSTIWYIFLHCWRVSSRCLCLLWVCQSVLSETLTFLESFVMRSCNLFLNKENSQETVKLSRMSRFRENDFSCTGGDGMVTEKCLIVSTSLLLHCSVAWKLSVILFLPEETTIRLARGECLFISTVQAGAPSLCPAPWTLRGCVRNSTGKLLQADSTV